MKLKVQKTEFKKIVLKDFEIELPEETKYYFFRRTAYMVKPIWTTWQIENHNKPEEIWEYKVVELDTSLHELRRYFFRVTEIGDILNDTKRQSYTIVNHVVNWVDDDTRTQEQFERDFKDFVEEFSLIIFE